MIPVKQLPLHEQRQALRQQLFAQRQSIARQLNADAEAGHYPRSMTMRFLTGKSLVGARIFKGAATALGMGVVKSLAASVLMPMFAKRKAR